MLTALPFFQAGQKPLGQSVFIAQKTSFKLKTVQHAFMLFLLFL
jgi:hypothetical protein